MRRSEVTRTWLLFATILVLCLPFIVLGSVTDVRLLPGLPLSALMVVPIGLAACLFAYRRDGLVGVRDLLMRVADYRRTSPRSWHLVSALLMPGVVLLGFGFMRALQSNDATWQIRLGEVPLLAGLFFVAAALEEIAWSGTALEPLQNKFGPLLAALIIGVYWAVLHVVPYVQVQGPAWALGQCVFSVVFRVVLVWLYDATAHSVFAAVLCHASYNTTWQLLPSHEASYDPWTTAAITALVALFVTGAYRSWMLRPQRSQVRAPAATR